jgi:hypothetical protein
MYTIHTYTTLYYKKHITGTLKINTGTLKIKVQTNYGLHFTFSSADLSKYTGMYVQLGGVQSLLRTKPIDILLERIRACLHQHVDNCLRVVVVKSDLIAVAKMQCCVPL